MKYRVVKKCDLHGAALLPGQEFVEGDLPAGSIRSLIEHGDISVVGEEVGDERAALVDSTIGIP